MLQVLNSFVSNFLPGPEPGDDSDHPLDLLAVPGLMTILDVALYRSVEGQLTATTCSGHALLIAWLDLKHQSQLVLEELNHCNESSRHLQAEAFARLCMEAAWDATERLGTDKLAQSANLSDPYDNATSGGSNHVLSGVGAQGIATGVLDSKVETGRRFPSEQRPKDCWESSRLFCPDYVWADDVVLTCQRLLRNVNKHPFYSDDMVTTLVVQRSTLSPTCELYLSTLLQLVKDDIPVRLHQFRAAVEADSVVSKRLYLVKCEYRAPFRAFLEAHQSVIRAPPVTMVGDYLSMKPTQIKQRREESQAKLQRILETPEFVEALSLETACEDMEISAARALFPFTEMGRILEHKKARLVVVPGVIDDEKVVELQELLRRLKHLLCRRAGPETSTGIRPLLLDIRGMPRDEDPLVTASKIVSTDMDKASLGRLDALLNNLQLLGSLIKHKNAFRTEKRSDVDFPNSVIKGCREEFDSELFRCQVRDFFAIVKRQRDIVEKHDIIEEMEAKIRGAEMETSLAVASNQSLEMVRQRLELIATDRQKRFEVLKQMAEEVCLREMNLHVRLDVPSEDKTLLLQKTSALGLFGFALQQAGEPLPIG